MPDLSEMMTKRRPMAHVWPLLIVAGLGVAVAVAAWIAVSVWEERLAKAKFNDVAGDYATVLQHGLDAYLDKILALRAFYDASNGVERREFNLFTSQILAGHGDAMRLVWCPRVNGDERDAFEHDVRDNGLSDYSIKKWAPAGPVYDSKPRQEYFPILYSTVSHARTATFGTDLASEAVRSNAIHRAVDGDLMATAQNIELRNPIDGKRAGFLVFMPIYKPGLPHDNVMTRRRNVDGRDRRRLSNVHGARLHTQEGGAAAERRRLHLSDKYRRGCAAALFARRRWRAKADGDQSFAFGIAPLVRIACRRRCPLGAGCGAGQFQSDQLLPRLVGRGADLLGVRRGACLYVGFAAPCAAARDRQP